MTLFSISCLTAEKEYIRIKKLIPESSINIILERDSTTSSMPQGGAQPETA
jgi:hypothetical protein